MPKVLIMTFTYNREKLLPRAIESVLSQSFTDFEYIIVNNGSTDHTAEVIQKYAASDQRIRIHRREKNMLGLSAARDNETLIFGSTAPYLMFIDDDDYMEVSTMETLVWLLEQHQADIASVGSQWVYPDGAKKDKFVFEGTFEFNRVEAMKELLKREKFNSATGGKLYKKDVFKIDYPNVNRMRDIYREYRIINNIQKIVVYGKPLFYFYRHDQNMSGLDTKEQITPEKMQEHLSANTMRSEWLTEHMPEIEEYIHYCEISFIISLYCRIHNLQAENCYFLTEGMLEQGIAIWKKYHLEQYCKPEELEFAEKYFC